MQQPYNPTGHRHFCIQMQRKGYYLNKNAYTLMFNYTIVHNIQDMKSTDMLIDG